MSKLYHRFFMGNVLVFIDINIMIDILPDFIGFLMIINALNHLYENTQVSAFKKGKYAFVLLFLISTFSFIASIKMPMVGINHIAMPLVIASSSLLQMLGYFYFYEGSLAFTSSSTKESVVWFQRMTIILYTMSVILYASYNFFGFDTLNTLITLNILVQFIFYIAMLFHFRNLKRYFENKENQKTMSCHAAFEMEV